MDQPVIFRNIEGELLIKREADGDTLPIRAIQFFPLSCPGEQWGVFVREPDGSLGDEVVTIPRPYELPQASWVVLEEELRRSFYVIRIFKVYAIDVVGGSLRWTVETSEGEINFFTVSKRAINVVGGVFVYIRDTKDRRLLIHLAMMDKRSVLILDMVI